MSHSNTQRSAARKVYFSFDEAGAFQGADAAHPERDMHPIEGGNVSTSAGQTLQQRTLTDAEVLSNARARFVRSPDALAEAEKYEGSENDFFSVVSAHKASEESVRSATNTPSGACESLSNSGSMYASAQRYPSSTPMARRDTRFVSAPTPSSAIAQDLRRGSETSSSSIQTPLPLYHATTERTLRRGTSMNAALNRCYPSQIYAESGSGPYAMPRQCSDSASMRSAMRPGWRMGQQGMAANEQQTRPSTYTSTLASLYDRVVGSTGHDGNGHAESSHRHDIGREEKYGPFANDDFDEPMEPDDPQITGLRRKSMDVRRDAERQDSMTECAPSQLSHGSSKASKRPMRKLTTFIDPIKNSAILASGTAEHHNRKARKYHSSVHAHIDERRRLVLKMARALMFFGAPSHRVESQLNALARTLDVDAQFIHFPGIVIANFGDFERNTSQCHFVKSKTEIALGRLNEVHGIYKALLTDDISVSNADRRISEFLNALPEWSNLSRILFSIVKCGMMAPINFSGSFVDIWIAALFGGLLTFSQLCLAGRNQMFSNTFDIAMAILFSFLSRLLSAKSVFCYEAIASSGLIALLPGYAVLCASLELASKNMMAGSVRMVYAIIYSLFLGFALAIGSELYYWMDPVAREQAVAPLASHATELMGSFILANQTLPEWTGTFTFTNSSTVAEAAGTIICARSPEWPWWRQSVPAVSKALTVPLFALLSCLSFLHPLRSREVPVSVLIACIGYAANGLANRYIFNRSDVVSAIGSFVIGILGNAYSRIWNATAFTAITVAVNFLVPTGMAMAGGLAMTYKGSDGDLYTNGISLGFRMVQVSIGITTGLFVSALLVHMLGNKRSNAVLFAF